MSMKTAKNRKKKIPMIERIPEEGKEKVRAFASAVDVYFKNQIQAALVLKCEQATICRYIHGVNLVPLEVARRFSRHTKGHLSEDSIFFDYGEWLYDQKNSGKSAELKAA